MPAWLLGLCCVLLGAAPVSAKLEAPVTAESALGLLESHLPAKTPAERADCQQLAAAVRTSVVERPNAAYALLSMALSVPRQDTPRWLRRRPRDFPCGCVVRITQAAMTAAPARGAEILEAAVMLFPDCAENLTAVVTKLEALYGNLSLADADTGVSPGNSGGPALDPGASGANAAGPGFPGSPGFPSGGGQTGLPFPVQPPVTSDTNG